ncbi:MAG: DHA1 family bicyclomycin/chloramphenicol resistance-like MFS transporter [Saprospiraceae bacterium]
MANLQNAAFRLNGRNRIDFNVHQRTTLTLFIAYKTVKVMVTSRTPSAMPFAEFIALMALLTSIVALAIDTILPGLYEISSSLGAQEQNQRQQLISVLFLGMAISQIVYGPISDAVGRKKPIYVGLALFIIGSVISALAQDFSTMLFGRFLQGVGAAGPKIVCMAIVRDQYAGREMARILSLIMVIFLMVPAVAPALGQTMLYFFEWQAMFWMFVGLASVAWIWLIFRQPETLDLSKRNPVKFRFISARFIELCQHKTTMVYTIAAGLVFGAFIGFLNSAQQILQEHYALGNQFALYFATLAIALGIASYINAKLVMRFGMRSLCRFSLSALTIISFGFLLIISNSPPSLVAFMAYLIISFLVIGLLFGNFNALALEPQGHIAGLAAAFVGSLSSLISLGLGYLVGFFYNDTIIPLVVSFAVLSLCSLVLTASHERGDPMR